MGKGLKKVLRKVFASDMTEQLAVADAKLGSVIKVCSLWPPHSGRESFNGADVTSRRISSTSVVCTARLFRSFSGASGLRPVTSSLVGL